MKVEIDLKKPLEMLSPQSVQRGRYAMANQAIADMDQFVPMQEGTLRMMVSVDVDGQGINYNAPYSKAQFYGFVGKKEYRVRNYTTPGTSRRWDLRGKAAYMSDWESAFVEGMGL